MNYAESGRELLLELQQQPMPGQPASAVPLPPYNTALVRTTLQEWQLHLQALQDQALAASRASTDGSANKSVRPSLKLHQAALERLKRCLLTYHKVRLDRLQQSCYWQRGNEQAHEEFIRTRLSPSEREFLTKYEEIVQRHTQTVFGEAILDMRAHLMPPIPVERVQVRVLDTAPVPEGPIVLESGASVWLRPGSTHFLAYRDVEEYIRQGILQVILGEEEA
jgi:GINS complex subunit 1